MTGSRIGPYEILALIGAGGMGQVWKARDTRLDRIVAIKVAQETFSERFEREARTVAALNHPHICTLYDVGPDYLVMEYIEGKPLQGPLPLDRALKYAAQICDALDAAHKKHIVHRDLKPGNILVTKSGVKLLDFGLAKISSAASAEAVTLPVTQDGMVLGTLQYMSPEQLEGKEADSRSDIYSLGLVLYEMMTGKRAFPHTDLEPLQPPAFERVVKTCLAKDPDARWQSARDVTVGLEWTAESQTAKSAGDSVSHSPWRERIAWILATTFLIGFLLIARSYWTSWPSGVTTTGAVSRLSVNPPEKTVFARPTNATVPVLQFALSPDGRSIVFAAGAVGSKPILWVRPLDDLNARPLFGTEDAQNPFWSPDGLWIGFFADGKLKKTPALSGAVQLVAGTDGGNLGGSWGPDDTILFADGTGVISRVLSGGGAVTPVTQLDAALEEGTHRWPYFLPDGQHFLYTVRAASAEARGIYVGSLDGKTKKLLLHVDSGAFYALPGYLMYLEGDTLLGWRFDTNRLELMDQPFTIAAQVGQATTGQVAVSASAGTLAHAGSGEQLGRLTWFDSDGNRMDPAISEGDYTDFRLSRDEKRLAASLVNLKTGQPEVWITDLEGGDPFPLVFGPALNSAVLWSPDDARLIFRTNRTGQIDLYQKSAAGGGNEVRVLSGKAVRDNTLLPTDWSRNGYLIFTVQSLASGNDLAVLPIAGDPKPVPFIDSPFDQMHGNFSPDGRFVAYTSNESGRFRVYVETFPRSDSKWPISNDGGYEPRWGKDGREIYYLSEDRKLMAVIVEAGPTFRPAKPLFQTQVPAGVRQNRTNYVPSGDGRRFLINTQTETSPTSITVVLNWIAGLKK